MQILYIDACVRGSDSRTRALADVALDELRQRFPQAELKRHDLYGMRLPPMDAKRLAERERLCNAHDWEAPMLVPAVDFQQADVVVIAAPYWDLSFPAVLKTWVENMWVRNLTFVYRNNLPVGLCRGKACLYLTTSGSPIDKADYGTDYVRGVMTTLGIPGFFRVSAEGLDIEGADVAGIMAQAKQDVRRRVNDMVELLEQPQQTAPQTEKADRISVMITAFNAAPWLDTCLASVTMQTLPPDEIIVVDDGSTDGTADLLNHWALRDARIKVLRQANRGVSAARNAALDAAAGDVLMFVDSDDWLEPDCLEKLYRAMCREQTPLAVCNHYIERKWSRELAFRKPEQAQLMTAQQAMQGVLYHHAPDVSCWGKLYRRQVLTKVRYPEGKLYEDTATIAQVLMAAGRMAWEPDALYHYRIRPDSISRDRWSPEKLDFIDAVRLLCDTVCADLPALAKGTKRRMAHAYLSVRRYFVDCPPALQAQRNELEAKAKQLAPAVMTDSHAPLRDKVALLALMLGSWAYDALWKRQSRE